MPTPTAAPPEVRVVAVLPASAARLAADVLAERARHHEATAAGSPELIGPCSIAGHALHRAGWSHYADPAETVAELNRRADVEPSTGVHLPTELAEALLTARGWTKCEQALAVSWTRPGRKSRADGGTFGDDYLWEFPEALTEALAAEALAVVTS